MKYPILLKNQRSCVRNWSSMSSQLTKRQQRRAIAKARQTIKQNIAFLALKATSSILIQKNFRLKLQRQAHLNVLETARLALEDERSHRAEAERIRDLRSASMMKRDTGTVSISGLHYDRHVVYSLIIKLNTTTDTEGETKGEIQDIVMEGRMFTRFSEVFRLHHDVLKSVASTITMPIMPPKTWCKNPTNVKFLTRRKEKLNIYLNQLLSNPAIVRSSPMRQFLARLQNTD